MKKQSNNLSDNKKALFEYEVLETFEVGIVFYGPEVKSVKQGDINIRSGYASLEKGEVLLKNVHISPYKPAVSVQKNYDPLRERKLLLNRKEIQYLEKKTLEKGFTLVPLSVYLKKGKIKLKLGLCRGKKSYDKRHSLKEKTMNEEIKRHLKNKYEYK